MASPATSTNVSGGLFTQKGNPPMPAFALSDLAGVVARKVRSARAQGRDYTSQSRAAAYAVMAVRPDLSLGQALDAVERLRIS